jgi:hypothetical protein
MLIPGSLAFAGAIGEHPAPGTSIVRFAQLDSGVYKGSKPKSDADYAFLQSQHIKYIVNLRFLPFLDGAEKRKAKSHGISYVSATINASTFAPSEKHVDHILSILRDPCHQPVYFHCDLGRDRTSLIATLYQVYFKNLPADNAWQEMKTFGFKDSWTLVGLKHYLLRHLTVPASLAAPADSCSAGPGQ